MSKITTYYHREDNSITWIFVYMGTYHTCDRIIIVTITIDSCLEDDKISGEDKDRYKTKQIS